MKQSKEIILHIEREDLRKELCCELLETGYTVQVANNDGFIYIIASFPTPPQAGELSRSE